MKVVQNLVSSSKYNIKCPYSMNAEFIVVHNTYNDAPARNEVAYMIRNNNSTSFHYAIDDKEIVQGIPENRNAWHAGDGRNGKGNRKGLSIEICYSKSGGQRFEEAEKLAAKFIASKLKEKNWGIDKVKKHQDFSGKYCPHRTLDLGWDRFLKMVQTELNNLKGGSNMSNDKNMPSNWAKEAWEWAIKNSITDCTRPKDNVTREELVTMLYRYYKKVK
jgi:N-acetylmuramoyl-L-alanine amidase